MTQPRNRRMLWWACATLLAGLALVLAGCSGPVQGSATAATAAPATSPRADEFPWEYDTMEATGSGYAPADLQNESQRALVGRQAARSAAVSRLIQRVSAMPVSQGRTVGDVTRRNASIRRSIERALQQAEVVSESEAMPGTFQCRVRASLKPVADILRRNHIRPDYIPPDPNTADAAVPTRV